jgi:chaperonin GroEL
MKQIIKFGSQAREQILEGIDLTANTVALTLGPSGRNCLINVIFGGIRATKDGISVINEISHDNPLINSGVKYVREASQKTATEAGDSTTTTAILVQSMCASVNKLLKAGKSPMEIRKGIELAKTKCLDWVKENATPINGNIDRLRDIATIASNNNKEIGGMIAEAFEKIGIDGDITWEESQSGKCEIDILGGYSFPRGFVSPYFINNNKNECELHNVLILIYDKKISKVVDLLAVLEASIKNQMPLVIIAAGCEGEAIGTLVANKVEKGLKVCVVFAPEQGMKRAETLQDIALFTGGKVISEEQGSNLDRTNFKPEWLGVAQKVIVTKDSCLIVNGQGDSDKIEERQEQIKELLDDAPSDHEREYLRKRIASIGKGVAVLYVGAPTEIETKELKDLVEDSILACRSGIEEGFLPGGGKGFVNCAKHLKSELKTDGEKLVLKALYRPLEQILLNSGLKKNKNWFERLFHINSGVYHQVIESAGDYGYNAKKDEFCNLVDDGIIDAAKVIRKAIENSCSIAVQFSYTEILISEMPD